MFARLRKLGYLMLKEILAEIHASGFMPVSFEQKIGGISQKDLPSVTLSLQNGSRVVLDGTVDRVDLMKCENQVFLRVVDYKSGTHKFSLQYVRSGLDIQLVLYLFAAQSAHGNGVTPWGAQYLYAANEKGKIAVERSGFYLDDETVQKGEVKGLSPLTQEKISDLICDMQDAVKEIATRILAGEAQKTPSDQACRYCPIRTHCDRAYLEGRS